jgi:hypothetical protein
MKLMKLSKLAIRKADGKKKASCELKGFRKVRLRADACGASVARKDRSSFIFLCEYSSKMFCLFAAKVVERELSCADMPQIKAMAMKMKLAMAK